MTVSNCRIILSITCQQQSALALARNIASLFLWKVWNLILYDILMWTSFLTLQWFILIVNHNLCGGVINHEQLPRRLSIWVLKWVIQTNFICLLVIIATNVDLILLTRVLYSCSFKILFIISYAHRILLRALILSCSCSFILVLTLADWIIIQIGDYLLYLV